MPACYLPAPGAPAVQKITGAAAENKPDPQGLWAERKEAGKTKPHRREDVGDEGQIAFHGEFVLMEKFGPLTL